MAVWNFSFVMLSFQLFKRGWHFLMYSDTLNLSNALVLKCFLKITQVGHNFLGEWVINLFGFAEGTFKMDKILQFVYYNKLPLVTKLTELNSARVYSSPVQLQVADISFTIISQFPCFSFQYCIYFLHFLPSLMLWGW